MKNLRTLLGIIYRNRVTGEEVSYQIIKEGAYTEKYHRKTTKTYMVWSMTNDH